MAFGSSSGKVTANEISSHDVGLVDCGFDWFGVVTVIQRDGGITDE